MVQTQRQSNDSTLASLATITANVNNMSTNISEIREDIKDIKGGFVTMDRFAPVEKIVYLLVGLIVTTVVGALLYVVINKGGMH